LEYELDFAVHSWKLGEQMAFESKVGKTVYEALNMFPDEGQEFAVPAAVVAGFAWVAARRADPDVTFDDVADTVTLEDFAAHMESMPEPEPAPLANRAQRRSTAKSSARSATTSTTRQPKSAT